MHVKNEPTELKTEHPTAPRVADAEGMPLYPNDAKAGLYAANQSDIKSAHAVMHRDRGALNILERVVGDHLAALACPLSGEAIERFETIEEECCLERRIVLWTLETLVESGVLISFTVHGGLAVCQFDVNSDPYYGDDQCVEPDWIVGEDYFEEAPCEDDEYEIGPIAEPPPPVRVDPNPKRHRIFLKTNYCCFYCSKPGADQIDHMHPRIRGGGNEDDNLIGACRTCNVRKNDRTVEEFRWYLSHRHRIPRNHRVLFYGETLH